MRLIFKGKILKDEMTLDEYKITDGLTVHVVKGKSASGAQPAASTASAEGSSLGGAPTTAASDAGAAQTNPMAGMAGFPGMGGMGGMPAGMGMPPGMGGMAGMPGMGGGAGGGMPDPAMMQ